MTPSSETSENPSPEPPGGAAEEPGHRSLPDDLARARRLVALELDLAETRRRLAEDNLKITEASLALAEEEIARLKAENERLRREVEELRGG